MLADLDACHVCANGQPHQTQQAWTQMRFFVNLWSLGFSAMVLIAAAIRPCRLASRGPLACIGAFTVFDLIRLGIALCWESVSCFIA